MWKKVLGLNNPMGWIVAGAMVLTFSEDARRGTRKALVKGMGTAMYLGDRVKGMAIGNGFSIHHLLEDARSEKKQLLLTEGGFTDTVKDGVHQATDKTKDTYSKTKSKLGHLFDQSFDQEQDYEATNVMNDQTMQSKMNEIAEEFHITPPNPKEK